MQALGERIDDPFNVEGGGSAAGLGILPIATTLAREKVCERATGTIVADHIFGENVTHDALDGYEIHVGETSYATGSQRFARLTRESDGQSVDDGATSHDGRALGTYLHGFFDDDAFRAAVVAALRTARGLAPAARYGRFRAEREARLDRLAAHVRGSLDLGRAFGEGARA
jgi:adenosylcobyric acid synthase